MSSRFFFCHNNTIAAAAAANNVYAWYPTMQLIDDGSTEDGVLASKASVSKPVFSYKIQNFNFFSGTCMRLKSRRNKKRIATAVCKWRDESNESN